MKLIILLVAGLAFSTGAIGKQDKNSSSEKMSKSDEYRRLEPTKSEAREEKEQSRSVNREDKNLRKDSSRGSNSSGMHKSGVDSARESARDIKNKLEQD